MRRIEPAFPDLLPVTHALRPGYLPGTEVALDPIRMGVVWSDAPRRVLPSNGSVPRQPVRAIAFARVAVERREELHRLLDRGSSVLLVLDDPAITPTDLGLADGPDCRLTALLPVLPSPLQETLEIPDAWTDRCWGAMLGLFPFPGADEEIEGRIHRLESAGATFAVSAPLLLTPKDRHRILDDADNGLPEGRLEDCLFHADVARGLHRLERQTGVSLHQVGMDAVVPCLVYHGLHPTAVRTSALLRLWARRLDQSHEESSWGWRLRRAASALEKLPHDPAALAAEDNLRVVPGFDPWVESFTRALWHGGEPVDSAWTHWSGED